MTRIVSSLCWAGALLGLAVADSYGLFERDTATMLYCLLPALAFMGFASREQCRLRRRGEA